ncbi:histidine phosphatase family protein [Devosia sp. Root635]|uniref:histidine phosphatase family protein n=1 Tax=Devosia sp. Root635 TaxID=1736575 RepID=UPI0006F98FE2|nr:histidine phosphatase family protein [Devosia sp. Root635]KRA55946.1 hypothetical protein ASD80_01310 [Devosia sp. Root635]
MTQLDWPDFYFARHGETDWNRERRYQGTLDIPLNDTGRKQADASGVLLRELLERDNVDPLSLRWFASPLGRAAETMERMRAAFDTDLPPVVLDPRLLEISFGTHEGRLHSEIAREQALVGDHDRWHYRPEQGESYDDVALRLLDFARELTQHAVVVAHGGVLRVLRHLVEGVERDQVVSWPPPQGAVAHFVRGRMTLYSATNTWDSVD